MLLEVGRATRLPHDLYQPNVMIKVPRDSVTPHILIYVIQILALIGPRFPGRRALFISTTIALAVEAQIHPYFSTDPGQVQPFTISWSYYLATIEKFLFSQDGNPEASFWRLDREPKEALSFSPLSYAKITWALMLIFNQRGIRWNFEVNNVPPMSSRSARSRTRFIISRTFTIIFHLIVADLMFQLSIRLFFTAPDGGIPGALNSKYLTLQHRSVSWSLLKCYVFAATPYFMIGAQYNIFSVVAVLLHLSEPSDWPNLYGSFSQATTVRNLWGKVWHQQLRRMFSTYTQHLVGWLGIRRGTNASSYIQLWTAFVVSGIFHALSQRNMPAPTNITEREKTEGIFWFFIVQAAAITVEDFAQWLWRKFWVVRHDDDNKKGQGSNETSRHPFHSMIGYVWVIFVLWISIPFAGDTFIRMRMGAESFLPFSVWKPVVETYVPVPPLMINWDG